ncbi:hypothetical protein [Sanguibacter sp. Leaf3]|uniref:hypothetical protein n=1 Tax=Sanguibacter sp. Leaf3 TaxID=1736209 RepID=UPI0006FAB8DD|nr:hypothetical protein [Sanguibacter sp. Leaf3]KQT99339.1 hypothetical protein ASG53_00155 [Sanguibacter sp. Leaf3]
MSDSHYDTQFFVVDDAAGTVDELKDALRTWAQDRDGGMLQEHARDEGLEFFAWEIDGCTFSISFDDVADEDRWFYAGPIADSHAALAVYRAPFFVSVTGNAPEDEEGNPDLECLLTEGLELARVFERPGIVAVGMGPSGKRDAAEPVPGTELADPDEEFVVELRKRQISDGL